MKILKERSSHKVAEYTARRICNLISDNPETVLILPADKTSLETYQILAKKSQMRQVSFNKVITFNLDEYIESEKLHRHMKENLFSKIDINLKNVHIPNGKAKDLKKECLSYEELLARLGPADLAILGLGINGHIGFNEPGSEYNSITRVVDLKTESVKAITLGIKSILSSKEILLLATGNKKADIIDKMVHGPITSDVPASFLKQHPNTTIVVDFDAGAKL